MLFDLSVYGIHLCQRALNGCRTANLAGHPDGEEDGAEATFFHARNVYASLFVAWGEIEVAIDETLRGVDVGVDDDRGKMEVAGSQADVRVGAGLAGHCLSVEAEE